MRSHRSTFDAYYPSVSALAAGWSYAVTIGRRQGDYDGDDLYLNTTACDGTARSYIQAGASLEGDLDGLFVVFEAACRVICRDIAVHGAGNERLNAYGEIYGFGADDRPSDLQAEMSEDLADISPQFAESLRWLPLPEQPPPCFAFRRAFPRVSAWLEGGRGDSRHLEILPAAWGYAAAASSGAGGGGAGGGSGSGGGAVCMQAKSGYLQKVRQLRVTAFLGESCVAASEAATLHDALQALDVELLKAPLEPEWSANNLVGLLDLQWPAAAAAAPAPLS